MRTAQRVIKNSSVLILSHILSKILYVFVIVFITRLLGVEKFGKFTFAISFVTLFSIFADFGLNTLTIREVARKKSEAAEYFKNGIFLKLLFSVVAYGLIIITVNLMGFTSNIIKVVYILGLWVILENLTRFLFSFFRAFEKMEYEAYLNVVSKIVLLVLVVFASKDNWGAAQIAVAYLIAAVVSVICGCLFIFIGKAIPVHRVFSRRIDMGFCRRLLKEAWPFALMTVFGIIYGRIDIIMLQMMKGASAVGWYGASNKLIEGLMFMPQMLVVALFPVFSLLYESSKERLIRGYEKIIKILYVLGLPIAVGGTILSSKIILLLFGAEYGNSAIVFQILVWALFFIFLNFGVGTILNSINRQRILTMNAGICVLVNVILNLMLIPGLSYTGAAAATVVTEAVLCFLGIIWIGKYLYRLPVWKIAVKPAVASVLMGCAVYLMKELNLILVIISGAVLYAVIIWKSGVISLDELGISREKNAILK